MPAPKKIYVLTQSGEIKGATYSHSAAENWLGMSDEHDYTPLIPDDTGTARCAPAESASSRPAKSMERSNQVMKDIEEMQNRLERSFRPKSSLLRPH